MTIFKSASVLPRSLWTIDGKHVFKQSTARRTYAPTLTLYRENGGVGRDYSLDEILAAFGDVTDVQPVKPLVIKLKVIKNQWHCANAFKKVGLPRLPVITADGRYGELCQGASGVQFEFDDSYTRYTLADFKVVYPLHYLKAVPEGEDG